MAIKLLHGTGWMASGEDKEDFFREANTTFNARHDNVVLLHGVCVEEEGEEEAVQGGGDPGQGPAGAAAAAAAAEGGGGSACCSYQPLPRGQLYAMVMGLADGTLAEAAEASGDRRYSTRALLYILATAADGLAFLHAASIVHRDIKPTNILLKGEEGHERGLVGDLGLAKVRSSSRRAASSFAGTLVFTDPAVMQRCPQDFTSDVYSFAVTMWEALSGAKAYSEMDSLPVTVMIDSISRGQRPDLKRSWCVCVCVCVEQWADPPAHPAFPLSHTLLLLFPPCGTTTPSLLQSCARTRPLMLSP